MLYTGIGVSVRRSEPTPGGPPAFSPLSLPTPLYWFDAGDAATMFLEASGSPPGTTPAADLDPVGAWRDKSANGRHITQAVLGNRPLRDAVSSPSVLTPDASDRLFSAAFGAIAQPFSIVFISDNLTNNSTFYDHGTAGTRILAQRGASSTSVSMFAGASLAATVPDTASRRCYLFEYNGASSKIFTVVGSNFVQAGSTGNAGTNTLADLRMFGNTAAFLSAIKMSETFASGAVLTAQQRLDTATYAIAKWGAL